jgi:hypothetical protein
MGVFLEELVRRDDVLVIVLDPMRNFHTMVLPNVEQERLLWDWNMFAEGVPVRLLVPGDPYRRYGREVVEAFERRGVEVVPLRLNPGDLPPDGWLELFGIDIATPMGLALYRAVSKLQRSRERFFTVSDIIAEIYSDPLIRETSIQALVLRLETAANDWDLFSTRYYELLEVFRIGAVNVVDLGSFGSWAGESEKFGGSGFGARFVQEAERGKVARGIGHFNSGAQSLVGN